MSPLELFHEFFKLLHAKNPEFRDLVRHLQNKPRVVRQIAFETNTYQHPFVHELLHQRWAVAKHFPDLVDDVIACTYPGFEEALKIDSRDTYGKTVIARGRELSLTRTQSQQIDMAVGRVRAGPRQTTNAFQLVLLLAASAFPPTRELWQKIWDIQHVHSEFWVRYVEEAVQTLVHMLNTCPDMPEKEVYDPELGYVDLPKPIPRDAIELIMTMHPSQREGRYESNLRIVRELCLVLHDTEWYVDKLPALWEEATPNCLPQDRF
jgi:hypothetical protein